MKCAIMQPTFLPWVGYFNMMSKVDIFVYLDDVQLTRRSWQVRNRILANGRELMITAPVRSTSRDVRICDAELALDEKWISATLRCIDHSYAKSPHKRAILEILETEFRFGHNNLADLNIGIIERIKRHVNFKAETVRSKYLKTSGQRSNRLLSICNALECDAYLAPIGSRPYIEEDKVFIDGRVNLTYHDHLPVPYPQMKTDQFVPYMSIVDLVANVGPDVALEYIWGK